MIFSHQGASPHRSGWQQARPGGGTGGNQGGGGGGGEEVALVRPHGNRCQGEGGNPGGVRGVPGGGGQAGGEEAGKHEEAEEGGGREEEEGKMQSHVTSMGNFLKKFLVCFREFPKVEKLSFAG